MPNLNDIHLDSAGGRDIALSPGQRPLPLSTPHAPFPLIRRRHRLPGHAYIQDFQFQRVRWVQSQGGPAFTRGTLACIILASNTYHTIELCSYLDCCHFVSLMLIARSMGLLPFPIAVHSTQALLPTEDS